MLNPRRSDRVAYISALLTVLACGIFLRLPAPLFVQGGSLYPLAGLHPNPKFSNLGFDEGLYRAYVNQLIRHGLTSYPDFAEEYVAVQPGLATVILPPTRFLYIFCAYLWHLFFATEALTSLRAVSSLFSMLLLVLAAFFAWRLSGPRIALCVAALMGFAPTQIHMGQHALIDGFFAFWATLCLWLLWENLRRPNRWTWLTAYTVSLALLVLVKENAFFAYIGLLAVLVANRWLRFGQTTVKMLLLTMAGPLLGGILLVILCGSAETVYRTYVLLVSKASVLPYAIATGDGPWYRYLVDLMLMSPVILVLAIGGIFSLKSGDKPSFYLLVFVSASYAVMANVRYGMNLRYTNMWDMPLRYFATVCVTNISSVCGKRAGLCLGACIALLCVIEFHQYLVFFVDHDLYELVTGGLLRAIKILK
jgi:dolichyl-phosphate-mannose-protein mannosyltransferase